MDRHTRDGRIRRAARIVLPTAMLGGVLAMALLIMAGTGRSDADHAPIPADSIESIEFVSFSPDALRDVLDAACAITGCDAADLHPMLTASAAAMTPEELTDALDAQARILAVGREVRATAAPGSDAYRAAGAEMATAIRLADLYRAERAAR